MVRERTLIVKLSHVQDERDYLLDPKEDMNETRMRPRALSTSVLHLRLAIYWPNLKSKTWNTHSVLVNDTVFFFFKLKWWTFHGSPLSISQEARMLKSWWMQQWLNLPLPLHDRTHQQLRSAPWTTPLQCSTGPTPGTHRRRGSRGCRRWWRCYHLHSLQELFHIGTPFQPHLAQFQSATGPHSHMQGWDGQMHWGLSPQQWWLHLLG